MKKRLKISIIIFVIIAIIALFLVLNKGHIGKLALVKTNAEVDSKEEVILPKLTLDIEKEYLSSKNKKETQPITVSIDGESVTEGVELKSSDEKIVKINKNN